MFRPLNNKSDSKSSSNYSSRGRAINPPSHNTKQKQGVSSGYSSASNTSTSKFSSNTSASSTSASKFSASKFSTSNSDKYKRLSENTRKAESYRSRSVYTYAPSTVRMVDAKDPAGCMIGAIAMAAGVDYDKVRDAARDGNFFSEARGMVMPNAQAVLARLGISTTQRPQEDSWDQFPDMAIVGVRGQNANHAVLFRRKNGVGYIYDSNNSGPVSTDNYSLITNDMYLSIDGLLRSQNSRYI